MICQRQSAAYSCFRFDRFAFANAASWFRPGGRYRRLKELGGRHRRRDCWPQGTESCAAPARAALRHHVSARPAQQDRKHAPCGPTQRRRSRVRGRRRGRLFPIGTRVVPRSAGQDRAGRADLRSHPCFAAARAAQRRGRRRIFRSATNGPADRRIFRPPPLAYALFFRARARPVSAHAPCKPRAIGSGRCAPAPFIRQPLPLSTRAYRTQAHRHPPPPAALPACPWPRRRSRQPPRLAPIWRPQARQILSRPPVPMRPVP